MDAEPMYLNYFTENRIFPFFIQYGHHTEDQKKHYHADFYELMIVLDGTAKQRVNHQDYYIKRGDVFVFGEGVIHDFKDVHDLHICNIMYQPSFLMDSCQDLGQLPGYHELFVIEPYLSQNDKFQQFLKLDFHEMEKAGRMIAGLLEEYSSKELGRRSMVRAGFQMLVTYLSRCYGKHQKEGDEGVLSGSQGLWVIWRRISAKNCQLCSWRKCLLCQNVILCAFFQRCIIRHRISI